MTPPPPTANPGRIVNDPPRGARGSPLSDGDGRRSTSFVNDPPCGARGSPVPRAPGQRRLFWVVIQVDGEQDFRLLVESGPTRLDAYLTSAVPEVTRAAVQSWIRDGRVHVNSAPALKPSHKVSAGDAVDVKTPVGDEDPLRPREISFQVVYTDAHVIVVDKPAELAVHPGAGHQGDTLVNGLLFRWPEIRDVGDPERPGLVHRLDKDTSGLLLVARSNAAYSVLKTAVERREINRQYAALVWGRVSPSEGIIDAPVGRDARHRRKQSVASEGRPARTRYRLLQQFAETALLELTLETGRMHQIRVHLAAIGFPVVGDGTYGRIGLGLRRQFLHASRLEFRHPVSGQLMELTSPFPADLVAALDLAGERHRDSAAGEVKR